MIHRSVCIIRLYSSFVTRRLAPNNTLLRYY